MIEVPCALLQTLVLITEGCLLNLLPQPARHNHMLATENGNVGSNSAALFIFLLLIFKRVDDKSTCICWDARLC